MLRGIAVFAMQGRWQSAVATALLSIAAFMLPPLSYLSSGVIVLSTLRIGPREGAKVLAIAFAIFALLAGLVLGRLWLAGLMLLSGWLPVYLATLILGYSRSLAAALFFSAGLGLLTVAAMHLFLPDPTQWWHQVMAPMFESLSQSSSWQLDKEQTQHLAIGTASIMTGLVAAGFTINVMLGLLLGRAWQASLYNQGAFAEEFCQLKLGKKAALLVVALMAITLSPLRHNMAWLVDCLPVLLSLFALQGLAVLHSVIRTKQKSKLWLVAVYVLLFVMMPQMMVLLATVGVVEQWFNFRKYPNG